MLRDMQGITGQIVLQARLHSPTIRLEWLEESGGHASWILIAIIGLVS